MVRMRARDRASPTVRGSCGVPRSTTLRPACDQLITFKDVAKAVNMSPPCGAGLAKVALSSLSVGPLSAALSDGSSSPAAGRSQHLRDELALRAHGERPSGNLAEAVRPQTHMGRMMRGAPGRQPGATKGAMRQSASAPAGNAWRHSQELGHTSSPSRGKPSSSSRTRRQGQEPTGTPAEDQGYAPVGSGELPALAQAPGDPDAVANSAQALQAQQADPPAFSGKRRAETAPTSRAAVGFEEGLTLSQYFDAAEAARLGAGAGADSDQLQTHPLSELPEGSDLASMEPLDVFRNMEPLDVFRNAVRFHMMRVAGSARAAFKLLDIVGSGHITMTQFADGVERLGVDWRYITGLRTEREIFKLFDLRRDGYIDFTELFPREIAGEDMLRCSTPEYLNKWCRNRHDEDLQRAPRWQAASQDEKMEELLRNRKEREDMAEKRRWMASTITRMKGRGKSIPQCREIVAVHLPRGTGPRDRHDVQAFTEAEVRTCKKMYKDRENDSTKKITRIVSDMKEQRKVLSDSRQQLYEVTDGPRLRRRQELELNSSRMSSVQNVNVKSAMGDALLAIREQGSVVYETDEEDDGRQLSKTPEQKKEETLTQMARDMGLRGKLAVNLVTEFLRYADADVTIGRPGFEQVVRLVLGAGRTFEEQELEAHWNKLVGKEEANGPTATTTAEKSVDPASGSEGAGSASNLLGLGEEMKDIFRTRGSVPSKDPVLEEVTFQRLLVWYKNDFQAGQ